MGAGRDRSWGPMARTWAILRPSVLRGPALAGDASVEALGQGGQELGVALGLRDPVEEELDALVGPDRGQHPAHGPDHLERPLLEEKLLSAGARALDVDRREDPLLRQLAVQDQLRVAGALELLVDHVVQAR